MSYVDRRLPKRPTSGEAPYALDETFFSRTDDRGVITAGNYIFHRVAGFEWEEMLNAPHRIIRHPDMPRGVFWLLWDTLKKGRSMGAYVKNRAKDGLYYWVYAVVVPCEGGYLSARIKPTSPILETVKAEYAALLKAEREEDLSPEQSAMILCARLQELGYEKYHLFAAHALSTELTARHAGLGNAPDPRVRELQQMLQNADDLAIQTDDLIREFEAMRTIPHNLRVIASRLEPTGGPVTTLSQNYGAMSREMSDWFSHHVLGKDSNFATIRGSVNHSLFLECMARVLQECDGQLNRERRELGSVDIDAERKILAAMVRDYAEKSRRGLRDVRDEADRILKACNVMHRHVLGLSSTRVMCKIESARLPESGDALTDIIAQLGLFQERISAQLDRIAGLSNAIRGLEGDAF
ncbi:PAS domain-containing protein [Aliiroseovarius sp.]|uniref:PAS domain-containing protein n=1 Tax=Aliiroseovarius sp. TaxID=1872442 RepID=UPI002617A70E|nr:PAS domain-containing protein [Aliiroseovarius sp.]